jgi:type II secretory pathway pseudopilin PulG
MDQPQKNGFTLVELLLYVGTTGLLLVAVTLLFSVVTQTRVKNRTMLSVTRQGQQTLQTMTRSLQRAESVAHPDAGDSGKRLKLTFGDADRDPTEFATSGKTITIKEGDSSALPLTNQQVQVSDFQVVNLTRQDTPGVVRIVFTLSFNNPDGRSRYQYSREFVTSVSLRPGN